MTGDTRPGLKSHLARLGWFYLFIGSLAIYTALTFYQIDLPGLHYDEAFEAVPAMQLLKGQPVTAFRGAALVVGQTTLPLMTQDYIGALNTYLAIPFIAGFGATPSALRAMSILVGAITLILTYILAYRLTYNRRVSAIAMLLLSVDPTFIFWNRQGIFVTAITAPIGLAVTYCWLRRLQGGSRRWSIAGAWLMGMGLYAKILFLWLIAALIGAGILLNVGRLWREKATILKKASWVEVVASLAAFFLGCWPLLVYNVQTGGTLLNITQHITTSYYGVNNLNFGRNLMERIQQFFIVLQGSHLWYLGDVFTNFFSLLVFVVVLFFVGHLTIRKQNYPFSPTQILSPLKVAIFPFTVIGLVILASIGTVSALWITHFAILMPWPALAIVIDCWFILMYWTQKWLKFIVWGGLALLFVTHLASTLRYHAALAISGGLSSHSDAVYDLSDWLNDHAPGRVAAMDWGLAAPVVYLSQGRVNAVEIFGYAWESDAQLAARLKEAIAHPDTLYLWRAPDEIIFDRSPQFKALYRPLNLEETIEEAFYERSGRPLLGVTRLVKQGTASNPPK
jgi:hypothetical protein